MNVRITPKKMRGIIPAIPSKSHAHRLLIAAALAGAADVDIPSFSQDIEATKRCLAALADQAEPSPDLDCGESGSTIRFLLPVTMALRDRATFSGSGKLPQRPLSPLREAMEEHGVNFTMHEVAAGGGPAKICTLSGRLQPGTSSLAGNVSSQFITGLLFALPLLDGDSRICLTTKLESSGYVDMTLGVLEDFQITVRVVTSEDGLVTYEVPGNQKYKLPADLTVEGDWSNACFWLACGALGGDVTCTGLDLASSQRDKEITRILQAMGADIDTNAGSTADAGNITTSGSIAVRGEDLHPLDVDASQIPDMVPVLAVLMAAAKGESHITNAGRLRIKESDRLETVREFLSRLGADITAGEDSLTIRGTGRLRGGTVSSHNDHRIAMAAAAASCICDEPVVIEDAGAVAKSYPDFYRDMASLGGKIDEI